MHVLDGRVGVEETGTHQVLRITGNGSDTIRELPRSFHVTSISNLGPWVELQSSDGRTVRATPGQLAVPGMVVPPELDPDHDTHLTDELLDAGTLVASDAEDAMLTASIQDDHLGEITFDPHTGVQASVTTPLGRVQVIFHGAGHERVTALIPAVRRVLSELPHWLEISANFLWQWGATGADASHSPAGFSSSFGVRAVRVYHSGAFGIELSDDETTFAEAFLDGYWPTVHFLPTGTPVFVTIEC